MPTAPSGTEEAVMARGVTAAVTVTEIPVDVDSVVEASPE